jgi:hypothetical protein
MDGWDMWRMENYIYLYEIVILNEKIFNLGLLLHAEKKRRYLYIRVSRVRGWMDGE